MPINVSEAIDLDTASLVTLKDRDGGSYQNGLFVEGSLSTRKALVSVQQPTSQQLELLDGSEKLTDIRAFYSNKKIYISKDGRSSTVISFNGVDYVIRKLQDWEVNGWYLGIGSRM